MEYTEENMKDFAEFYKSKGYKSIKRAFSIWKVKNPKEYFSRLNLDERTMTVIGEICRYFMISTEELISKSQDQEKVRARQFIVYILNSEYSNYDEAILSTTINRTKSNVYHILKKVSSLLEYDRMYQTYYNQILKLINTDGELKN